MEQDRLAAVTVSVFAVLAMLLAALGLYGVLAYATARRTAEFGVRMALGARPADVGRGVVREALRLVLLGAILGIPAALLAGRLLQSQLFGVGAADPGSIVGALVVLTGTAMAAALVPALRAARVSPLRALRAD